MLTIRKTEVFFCRILNPKFWFYGSVALISLAMNYPLARFPGEDLLWNDLMVLGRVAWTKAALFSNPFASVDFLQGLGSLVMTDVKVVPHYYDPGVLFSLIFGDLTALFLRSFFLVVYCLFCLDRLIEQEDRGSGDPYSPFGFRIPLLLFYVFSPLFFGDVAHHFSPIFYAIPGVVLALRFFLQGPSVRSSLALVGAVTLMICLSDVHLLFIGGTLGIFLVFFDRVIYQSNKKALGVAIVACLLIAFFSYARYLGFLRADGSQVVSQGSGWPVPLYMSVFFKDALKSLIFPLFSGPVCLYIAPYAPFMILVFLMVRQNPRLALRLVLFFVLVAGLFLFGLACHGVEALRVKLPSAMRYHTAIIPFLANLWIIFHIKDLRQLMAKANLDRINGVWMLFASMVFIRDINSFLFVPKVEGYLASFFFQSEMNPSTLKRLVFMCLCLHPLLFSLGVLFGERFNSKTWKVIFSVVLFVLVPLTYIPVQSYGFPLPVLWTRDFTDRFTLICQMRLKMPFGKAPSLSCRALWFPSLWGQFPQTMEGTTSCFL